MDDMAETYREADASPPIDLHQLNEALLQQLVDCVPVGAMLVDASGAILYANAELGVTLQYSSEDLIGHPISRLLPPELRDNHASLLQHYFSNPKKRQMGSGRELYALRNDDVKIPIEIGLNPIQGESELWVLATLVDISPRLQAHRMFQQSVASAPHGVLIVDERGCIHLANRTLCASFGYSESELLGQPMEMLLPERYRDQHQKLRKMYAEESTIRSMGVGRDLTALHRDGREFPVEIGLNPIENSEGRGMVQVSLMDITERKKMELELRETNTNLEEFTYVASHDLRSPLRGISDLLEWIEEDLSADTVVSVRNNIGRIAVRVQRMEQLIDNLLAYARAGRSATDLRHIDINALLDDISELLDVPEGFELHRDIQITSLMAMKTPLETVLRNLISNAIKHHDKSAGEITVSCMADHNFCRFSVRDDGPGIPEAAQERIFRLFQTATSSERSGTGIGLSVSRRLAETHGGHISIEPNAAARGATFTLLWPRFVRTDTHD